MAGKGKGGELKATAQYEQDSKRFHRYRVSSDYGVVGTLYVPKDKAIPEGLTVTFTGSIADKGV